MPTLKIQTYLRKDVAEKFKQYTKGHGDMPTYRASAYLIELGLNRLKKGEVNSLQHLRRLTFNMHSGEGEWYVVI